MRKLLTSHSNTLSVEPSELETRTPTMLTRLRKPPGKLATIEVRHSIVRTGFCRVDEKVSSLGMADFFFDKNNMKNSLLDLETEVTKTAALLDLLGERLAKITEESGDRNGSEKAAGQVCLYLDQSHRLIEVFYSVADEIHAMHHVRN